ncbi:NADH oxidase [Salmonella enterica subsp. enterica serovar Choleraesuis]|nr:NADH oxidase [Salmonella enterica subsp. enterica serovar Choleraesuis]
MTYSVALNFEDGVSRFIECNPGETVLDAAYRQKINLPMDCSDGVCGTCKCRGVAGDYELGDDFLEEALSEQEQEQGLVLTCQMVPSSDCVIEVPMASALCKTAPAQIEGKVVAVDAPSPGVFELTLDAQGPISWLPGQYVNLQIPGTTQTRAYSFSCANAERGLTFLIRHVPDGAMSGYLANRAQPGDALTIHGPQGSFYLRPVQRPLLMLAGGTGLAPLLAMLETLACAASTQSVHLIYGVNQDSDVVKQEQLESLKARLPGFSYCICVADETSQAQHKGYVTHHMEPQYLHDGDVDVYLCGPPPMVDAVLAAFNERNISPASFHYEKFNPGTPAQEQAA